VYHLLHKITVMVKMMMTNAKHLQTVFRYFVFSKRESNTGFSGKKASYKHTV